MICTVWEKAITLRDRSSQSVTHKLLDLPGQEHLSQLSSGLSFPSHTGAAGLYLFAPGGAEMFVIFFAVLLLFGGKKIPELMRGIGKGLKEFQDAKDSVRKSLEDGLKQEEKLKL